MVRFGQVSRSVRSGTGDLGDVITSQSPQKKRLPPAMAGHVRTVRLLGMKAHQLFVHHVRMFYI